MGQFYVDNLTLSICRQVAKKALLSTAVSTEGLSITALVLCLKEEVYKMINHEAYPCVAKGKCKASILNSLSSISQSLYLKTNPGCRLIDLKLLLPPGHGYFSWKCHLIKDHQSRGPKVCELAFSPCFSSLKGDLQTIFRFSYLKVYKLITLETKFKNL